MLEDGEIKEGDKFKQVGDRASVRIITFNETMGFIYRAHRVVKFRGYEEWVTCDTRVDYLEAVRLWVEENRQIYFVEDGNKYEIDNNVFTIVKGGHHVIDTDFRKGEWYVKNV